MEFLKVIGPLTDPAAYGGDAATLFSSRLPIPARNGFRQTDRPGLGAFDGSPARITCMARLAYEVTATRG
ncbi:hypothetical protein GCM10020220_054610 [Nonomuraea rubra]